MSTGNFGQALHALNLIHQKAPSQACLTALYGSGLLGDLLEADLKGVDRNKVREALNLAPILFIQVNYKRIEKVGYKDQMSRYDAIDPEIFNGFMVVYRRGMPGSHTRNRTKLFPFKPDGSHMIARRMGYEGYDFAVFEELMAYGDAHPEQQQKFNIIGPNASSYKTNGDKRLAYLGKTEDGKGRKLGLIHPNDMVEGQHWYLGVKRSHKLPKDDA